MLHKNLDVVWLQLWLRLEDMVLIEYQLKSVYVKQVM